ncbi:sugar transporter SWEET1-like [Gordionus sp. m RMFG-2023]|uniref:sugar transporter SWEET1-like n=1 Tax=Gordionus sp. m RMFG-2023 TaxID=3053472 RepID=UPI0031FD36AC
MLLLTFFGIVSVLATFALYSAGLTTCSKIKKQKNTDGISPFPFIFGLLCAAINFEYGIYKDDKSIICTNVFGIICQSSYVVLYIFFSMQKKQLLKMTGLTLMIIGLISLYVFHIKQQNEYLAIQYLGISSCTLALIFFASPLASVLTVFKEKSVKSMSFTFSMVASLVSLSWTIYGTLISDPYIQIPNFCGFLISMFQLYLFYHFKELPKSKNIEYNIL